MHIAYWFAEQNKRLKSFKVREKDTEETEPDGAYKAPPQVIYCGPSNKAVDVVTGRFFLLLIIWPCLKRTGNDQIQELDWLKSILTAV